MTEESIDWGAVMGASTAQFDTDEDTSASRREDRFVGPLRAAQTFLPGLHVFSHVSLEGWMKEVCAAGIAYVPFEVAARIPLKTIMNFESPDAQDNEHWATLNAVRSGLTAKEMLRWDCCASSDIKIVMQHGGVVMQHGWMSKSDPLNDSVPAWRSAIFPDDPRFFDIAYTYPGEVMPVIKRPWVEARREGSHPAEYRVFVENDQILGIANYYMQRDMTHSDCVHNEVTEALAMSQRLLDSMKARGSIVFNGETGAIDPMFEPGKISCTLDFLVDLDGNVLFLEAGPPFGLGAHPCAFMGNEIHVDGGQIISVKGVALALGQNPLFMKDFQS